MIQITHLTKRYGDHLAVDDLSFHVEKGQIYGFLGPNGAGKTTTMNMITGYIGATSGDIKINGYDIFEEPEFAKKSIGYLPEQPPLYMDMTPYEYLKFVAQLKKIDRYQREDMIEDIIKRTKIYDVQNRLIKNLSKGYKQRVGVAQALLGYPEIIILDEPTVGLDPKQIIEIRDLIKEIGKKHTVILSSHILSEVSAICDHVLIINKGKLVASDTPENLTKQLQGASAVSMTILAEQGQIEEVLQQQEYVDTYEIVSSETEKDAWDVEIRGKDTSDMRIRLSKAFAGYPVLRMQNSEVSLEDAFLELIQGTGEEEDDFYEGEEPEGTGESAEPEEPSEEISADAESEEEK